MTAPEQPTCRTFDDAGRFVCERPAGFIVWGHLYAKRDKGPKCARHLPPGALLPTGFGSPAIYEIAARPPAPTVTTEQYRALCRALLETPGNCPDEHDIPGPDVWAEYMVDAMLDAAGLARTVVATPQNTTPSTEGDHG